jgi:hypothetical protein
MAKKRTAPNKSSPNTSPTPPDPALTETPHSEQIEAMLKDSRWKALANYILQNLADDPHNKCTVRLTQEEMMLFRCPELPVDTHYYCGVGLLLLMLSRYGPDTGREIVNVVIKGRREKRAARSAAKHARWKQLRAEGKSWGQIQQIHFRETREKVSIRAITKAVTGK